MNHTALEHIKLEELSDITFATMENGEVLAEVFTKPQVYEQGDGTIPSIIVDGLDIRIDSEQNIEVHNLTINNYPHIAFIQYLNFQEFQDGSYEYDGVNVFIFDKSRISQDESDATHSFHFETMRDALLYLKQNFLQLKNSNASSINNPLDTFFGRKKAEL